MLTKQDYDTLIEAVDVWESRPSTNDMMGSMLGAMICRDDEQFKKFEEKQAEHRRSQEAQRKATRERSVMLRAKLIQMRDSIEAEQFVNSTAS